MSGGLVSNIRSLAVPMGVGVNLDILSELGINRAQKVFDQRVLALSDPSDYKDERNKQYTKLKTAVKKSYDDTITELKSSCLPSATIQQLAINAAANTYQSQNAILEADFPSGSTAIANSCPHGILFQPEIRGWTRARRCRILVE